MSGPQWLKHAILPNKWVLAVAGTHGKTTTSSILAWILHYAGLAPGFLIGGVPENFGISAELGNSPYFVVEADEYDTAFFDKRSKFVHYAPKTCVLTNLEYDHADIFDNMEAIYTQFHQLIRLVPSQGTIIRPSKDAQIDQLMQRGCWSPSVEFGLAQGNWHATHISADTRQWTLTVEQQIIGQVQWSLMGQHNILNALAAMAAAKQVGVAPAIALAALSEFKSVKRRLQKGATVSGITIYSDFAHHPTAIAATLAALRAQTKHKIIVLLEMGSHSMRLGTHQARLPQALQAADWVIIPHCASIQWDLHSLKPLLRAPLKITYSQHELLSQVAQIAQAGDQILILSNGAFAKIETELPAYLTAAQVNL
jgi:UDP-N-acetylmuramate: L-alanyl-gamma-D-glutamyl-meso-diaminopimelate ligase